MAKNIEKLIKEIEAQGYKVKPINNDVRHTFLLPKDLLERFMALVDKLGIKVKDAASEAMSDWIKKKS